MTKRQTLDIPEARDVLSIEGNGPFYVTLIDGDESLSVQGFDALVDAEAFHDMFAETLDRIYLGRRGGQR